MYFIGRILIKGLSLIYLAMSLIGFLGYFELERFSANVFNFFHAFLGTYSIIIPFICLIFAIVCWKISKIGDKDEDEDLDLGENQTKNQFQSLRKDRVRTKSVGKHTKMNGFYSYFTEELSIKSDQFINEDQYENLGRDFTTYFGQGEKNIYLPPKIVNLQGFKNYFREKNIIDKVNNKIENSPGRKESLANKAPKLFSRKPVCSSVNLPIKEVKLETRLAEDFRSKTRDLEQEKRIPKDNPTDKEWQFPSLELLNPVGRIDLKSERHNPRLLEDVLSTFGVTAKVVNITNGPILTRYEISPAPGTKISKIVNLADDISLALASREIRIEAPIPGKAAVGIEIPRLNSRTVFFREVIDSEIFSKNKGKIKVALGKDIADSAVVAELEKMPHLLVAGATGSGKSIFINCLINSLLYSVTPDEVKLLLIDPKMVELSQYNGIPHLFAPVVTDPKKANKYLNYIVKEMENRYELFAANGVRDIDHFNRTTDTKALPYIVVIIDELADLMMVASNEIEESICRLAQMARAAGIHLVIATQRPSVNVITGLIKANIPSRISFAVSSQIDSRTILDTNGPEKLLGKGDMLYSPIGMNKPVRVHGCFIEEQEVKNVIEHWRSQGQADYILNEDQLEESISVDKNEGDFDERFVEAGELVITTGVASISFLQRRLRVGYSRAARLMDMLEEAGVVGGYEGNRPRDILMSLEAFSNEHCS